MLIPIVITVPRLTVLLGVIESVYEAAATNGMLDIATAIAMIMHGVIDRSLIPSLRFYRISGIRLERVRGRIVLPCEICRRNINTSIGLSFRKGYFSKLERNSNNL